MPKAYGIDFREKILEAYLHKEGSIPELAKRFKVSSSTVKRIGRRYRDTGEVLLYLHYAGRHELIDKAGEKTLKAWVTDKPDLTLLELQSKYYQHYGVKPVLSVFSRVLRKLKLNYKKKSRYAQQQETDEVKKKRRKKREEFIKFIESNNANDMIILDESGAHLAMARLYGRAEGRSRVRVAVPYPRGSKYSIISAISTEKIVASLYCEDSIDGDFYTGFIEQCLVPRLEPRHKIIMDNIAFHKVKKAEELILSTGAQLVYLPPYSPDLSPIELMWSKIKTVMRSHAARTAQEFQNAIFAAFQAIESSNLLNWFRHCGYRIKQL